MSKRNVQYIKQDEPDFIKRMKQNAGYTEGPTIETKNEELPIDESESENEDEKPQIVVLKKGDLNEDEVARIEKGNKDQKDFGDSNDLQPFEPGYGKILFKKPNESKIDQKSDLEASSKKNAKINKKESKKLSRKDSKTKTIRNKSLLSFDEEDC